MEIISISMIAKGQGRKIRIDRAKTILKGRKIFNMRPQ